MEPRPTLAAKMRRRGRRVVAEAAVMPKPGSMVDQISMPKTSSGRCQYGISEKMVRGNWMGMLTGKVSAVIERDDVLKPNTGSRCGAVVMSEGYDRTNM